MTDPKAPIIRAPRPPRNTKGEPPKSAADTAATGSNTSTAIDGQLVDLNFKVPAEFRKDFRLFCATHDLSQVGAFREAMVAFMRQKGWPTPD